MKYNFSSCLIFWFGLILLGSCASGKTRESIKNEPPQKLLLFQKTPCYGTCPAYNATFYSDGKVFYEGFRYVPVLDTLTLQLTPEQLQEVKHAIQELDYTSLESSYPSPYTDLPSSYLTFYEGGREVKRVKHQQDGPEKLQKTIRQLHDLVMSLLKKP